jgi:hypothetical protein
MKKQAKQYSAEEKTKVALEAIAGELTMAQITSKYGVHAKASYTIYKNEVICCAVNHISKIVVREIRMLRSVGVGVVNITTPSTRRGSGN